MSFTADEVSRIIEMAWEDRTPFEAIAHQFDLNETQVISLMKQNLRRQSYKLWRRRVSGRVTKHLKIRHPGIIRGYCATQYKQR